MSVQSQMAMDKAVNAAKPKAKTPKAKLADGDTGGDMQSMMPMLMMMLQMLRGGSQ